MYRDDNPEYIYAYETICMFTTFIALFCISFFWIQQARYKHKLELNSVTDSSYAVMLTNLPKDVNNSEIKSLLMRAGINKDSIVYINR